MFEFDMKIQTSLTPVQLIASFVRAYEIFLKFASAPSVMTFATVVQVPLTRQLLYVIVVKHFNLCTICNQIIRNARLIADTGHQILVFEVYFPIELIVVFVWIVFRQVTSFIVSYCVWGAPKSANLVLVEAYVRSTARRQRFTLGSVLLLWCLYCTSLAERNDWGEVAQCNCRVILPCLILLIFLLLLNQGSRPLFLAGAVTVIPLINSSFGELALLEQLLCEIVCDGIQTVLHAHSVSLEALF